MVIGCAATCRDYFDDRLAGDGVGDAEAATKILECVALLVEAFEISGRAATMRLMLSHPSMRQ